jgi:hypothetical protein
MKGTNLVLLRPGIAQAFPTAEAVNDALQSLIDVATRSTNLTTRSTRMVNASLGVALPCASTSAVHCGKLCNLI